MLRLTRRAGWTTMKPMNVLTLDSVIEMIRRRKEAFERDYGVKRIGVFGSVARNETNEMSDVDIVSLRETMNVNLKNRIQNEAVYARLWAYQGHH